MLLTRFRPFDRLRKASRAGRGLSRAASKIAPKQAAFLRRAVAGLLYPGRPGESGADFDPLKASREGRGDEAEIGLWSKGVRAIGDAARGKSDAARDVASNVAEIPRGVVHGAIEAVNEFIKTAAEFPGGQKIVLELADKVAKLSASGQAQALETLIEKSPWAITRERDLQDIGP